MKKCPQGHDNPDNANFCRICRYEFVEKDFKKDKEKAKEKEDGYTLDLFPNIEFLPRAVSHITFGNSNFKNLAESMACPVFWHNLSSFL